MPVALTTYSHSIDLVAHADAGDALDAAAGLGDDVGDGDALEDPYAELARALGECGRQVDGVDPAVAGYVEAGQQVVGLRPGEQRVHLGGGDLVDLQAEVALERGDPAVLLQPVGVRRRLDQPHRLEAGGLAGLGLQPGVQLAGVQPHRRRRLRERPEARHQPRRVPRRAAGQPVALEEDHVAAPPEVGEVVGDRGTDDAAPDDDDAGTGGEFGSHGSTLSEGRVPHAARWRCLRHTTRSEADAPGDPRLVVGDALASCPTAAPLGSATAERGPRPLEAAGAGGTPSTRCYWRAEPTPRPTLDRGRMAPPHPLNAAAVMRGDADRLQTHQVRLLRPPGPRRVDADQVLATEPPELDVVGEPVERRALRPVQRDRRASPWPAARRCRSRWSCPRRACRSRGASMYAALPSSAAWCRTQACMSERGRHWRYTGVAVPPGQAVIASRTRTWSRCPSLPSRVTTTSGR